jgi:peptidoglycan hydrolase-like protein with peptidoglycan-binding domain
VTVVYGDLVPGSAGVDAEDLQGVLQGLGYPVERTGFYDVDTTAAVMQFKRSHNLGTDSLDVDKATFDAMLDVLSTGESGGANPTPRPPGTIEGDPIVTKVNFGWALTALGILAAAAVATRRRRKKK